MSFTILLITMLVELALFRAYINQPAPLNTYRRSPTYRKAMLMVRLDRIATHRL